MQMGDRNRCSTQTRLSCVLDTENYSAILITLRSVVDAVASAIATAVAAIAATATVAAVAAVAAIAAIATVATIATVAAEANETTAVAAIAANVSRSDDARLDISAADDGSKSSWSGVIVYGDGGGSIDNNDFRLGPGSSSSSFPSAAAA